MHIRTTIPIPHPSIKYSITNSKVITLLYSIPINHSLNFEFDHILNHAFLFGRKLQPQTYWMPMPLLQLWLSVLYVSKRTFSF